MCIIVNICVQCTLCNMHYCKYLCAVYNTVQCTLCNVHMFNKPFMHFAIYCSISTRSKTIIILWIRGPHCPKKIVWICVLYTIQYTQSWDGGSRCYKTFLVYMCQQIWHQKPPLHPLQPWQVHILFVDSDHFCCQCWMVWNICRKYRETSSFKNTATKIKISWQWGLGYVCQDLHIQFCQDLHIQFCQDLHI